MTIETTVNKHRGALLIAIGGFLIFLYIRHKRQQAAAAAAAQAAAAQAAAAQDPGTMDQATYDKQFSQPAPAYLGSPFSGYGANAPNYPPPTQLQPGPTSPAPPITFPNPAASSGNSTVPAATGGGAPNSQSTGTPPLTYPDGTPVHGTLVTDSGSPFYGKYDVGGGHYVDPPVVHHAPNAPGWTPPNTPEWNAAMGQLQVPPSLSVMNASVTNPAFVGRGAFVQGAGGPEWQWTNPGATVQF